MKSLHIAILAAALLLTHCKEPVKPVENQHPIDRVESGTPINVMLTSYSTTLMPQDTIPLRIVVTDEKAREITSAKNTIRLFIEGSGEVLNQNNQLLTIELDSNNRSFATDSLKNGVLHLFYIAPNQAGIAKVEAEALSTNLNAPKIWPGAHEMHILPAGFNYLKPTAEQLPPTTKPIDKMIGADISFLPELEDKGLVFTENGKPIDPVIMLKNHGFNYIRLRVFVNPENEKGYSPGKDYCGLEKTLALAKRVHEAGFKILLDFHYSDTWADPQKQFKPKAWEGLDFATLTDSVTSYTIRVMNAFKNQGTAPQMVQVGNEINHGMIWPDGHIGNPDQLAQLLKAGIKGVKTVDPQVPVMEHLALGGQNTEAVFWLDNMLARGVEFDIIGLSYYPRWHGTLSDLENNLNDLSKRYHKPLNVVEYNWYKKEVHDIVFQLPNNMGKGACAWEPLSWQTDMVTYEGVVNAEVIGIYDQLSAKWLSK